MCGEMSLVAPGQDEDGGTANVLVIPRASGSAELPVDFWIIIEIYMIVRMLSSELRYEKSLERSLDTVHAAA